MFDIVLRAQIITFQYKQQFDKLKNYFYTITTKSHNMQMLS